MDYLEKVSIISENLKLIPINEEYIQDIFQEFTAEITRYMYPQASDDIKDIENFVSRAKKELNDGTDLQLIITNKTNGEFMGCAGLHKLNEDSPELGIWLKKGAHGNGYGLEAISVIIAWARENISFKYLTYPVDRNNIPSKRIPESLGGVLRKEYRSHNINGDEMDLLEYWIY